MIPLKDNHDVASFLVTKHSWKGKYKRVFSVGTHGITTYHPERFEVTNRWLYSDVINVTSSKHSNTSSANHDFTLQFVKKEKKADAMKFSSEHKCLILTEALKYRHLFAEKPKEIFVSFFYVNNSFCYNCYSYKIKNKTFTRLLSNWFMVSNVILIDSCFAISFSIGYSEMTILFKLLKKSFEHAQPNQSISSVMYEWSTFLGNY